MTMKEGCVLAQAEGGSKIRGLEEGEKLKENLLYLLNKCFHSAVQLFFRTRVGI